jgi:glycosyltransferase involved in cell wall biosynthesis
MSFLARLHRWVISLRYKEFALSHRNLKVIFHNSNDEQILSKIVGLSSKDMISTRGSGVDLEVFKFTEQLEGIPDILMVLRLLVDKGVWVFIDASRSLKSRGFEVRFALVGAPDHDNPNSITHNGLEGG